MQAELIAAIGPACELGEGVLWDHRSGHLWWTDIVGRQLHRWHFERDELETYALASRLCSFALSDQPGLLLCAFDSYFALYDPEAAQALWQLPLSLPNNVRLNDGRLSPEGRFWCGSMVEQDDATQHSGELFSLSRGKVSRHVRDIRISNGLCWSVDGQTLYFADSPRQRIDQFDYDPLTGDISNRRIFAHIDSGYPDGACVDSQDFVYSALWGAAAITRFDRDGKAQRPLALPVQQPTCVCFAGPELNYLCVSSARQGLNNPGRDDGKLLVLQTKKRGLPAPYFRQDSAGGSVQPASASAKEVL